MDRDWEAFVRLYTTATSPSPTLPSRCPGCGVKICWGWAEEELDEPSNGRMVRFRYIPRLDQTVFCPNCEAQILN